MYTTLAKQHYGEELGAAAIFFRSIAAEIDQDPNAILQYLDHPALILLRQDRSDNTLNKVKLYEALAYGDTACLFASPRPCLSGLLLKEIGTEAQYEAYHQNVRENSPRTCFAVTEPLYGSDVAKMESFFTFNYQENIWHLNGHKYLFGNGTCADIGVVWARVSPGPFGIRAALIRFKENATETNIERSLLPMLGLRGAQLSSVKFNNFPIHVEDMLGLHVHSLLRGINALVRTFNKMRICIAALAIGQSQAICDYIQTVKKSFTNQEAALLKQYQVKIDALRQRIGQAAVRLDEDPERVAEISLLKSLATTLVEGLVNEMFSFFGQAAFFEHPFLAKSFRDAFAYEFADGTIHVQRNNIFEGYQSESL